ncbi:GNAT family N-acetyltransferase [Pyxidicoccus fallax]|uniref:GNAT family N-acetyltransferase n=1 Tax=Pyxidicoccus fallax TaxID=394095 RepID=A0A848LCT1_9BACT|nr:GNAT family N-acetyltransferase [Pyxidicoccus fallax]NMO16286.1 GNAT family N-acetyltransferase [Pyxidicoccus fallax]NPC81869.1 GNAT family N-acetyltransferase [Pyxidicoccus fallax]
MIREAVSEDASLLARLLRDAFEEYRGRLEPPSSAHGKTEEVVRRELHDGGALIAESPAGPEGCVFFHPRGDHVYLDRLAVLPPYRGRGVARALMEAVEARARDMGPLPVRLNVRLALKDHQEWYARQGYAFLRHGTHEGHAAPTYVVLEKRF